MNIQKIVGEFGPLSQLCNGGACPAAILTEEGDVFVQGYTPSHQESKELSAPAGEGFVRIPKATFERIVSQLME